MIFTGLFSPGKACFNLVLLPYMQMICQQVY